MQTDAVIRQYLDGNEAALRLLLDRHSGALRSRIERRMAPLLRRRVSVHDVMQEVSMLAFEKRGEFTGNTFEEFQRWILAIADLRVHAQVNHHAGTQKRALYRDLSQASGDQRVEPVSPLASPSQDAIGAELAQLAAQSLAQLSPDHREVIRLHRENGNSLRDVAMTMNRSHEAVKKLHGRAMLAFATHFDRLRGDHHDE